MRLLEAPRRSSPSAAATDTRISAVCRNEQQPAANKVLPWPGGLLPLRGRLYSLWTAPSESSGSRLPRAAASGFVGIDTPVVHALKATWIVPCMNGGSTDTSGVQPTCEASNVAEKSVILNRPLQRDQCQSVSHTQSAPPRVARRHAATRNPPDSLPTHLGVATQATIKAHKFSDTSAGAALASAPCAR